MRAKNLCVRKKTKKIPYLPTQNVWADFCNILHKNLTPPGNDNPASFSISLTVLYLQGSNFQLLHIGLA